MKAASAWRDVTPDHPVDVFGQMGVRRGEYTRDPLTVNAAVFEEQGRRVTLVSADICVIPDELAASLRKRIADDGQVDPADFIINATHTHVAPCPCNGIVGEVDDAWYESFQLAVVAAVREAAGKLKDVTLWAGSGYLDQLGWNRRGYRRDGTVQMYNGSWHDDYKGIEGPRDGQVGVIWAADEQHNVSLVISSFATHPNCVSSKSFYSADLPGEVRKVLRGSLGQDVGVLYMTGAAGDTAPNIMENNQKNVQPWTGETGLKRSGQYLGGEILKTIASTIKPMDSQTLGAAHKMLDIPMRPWDTTFDPQKLAEGGMKKFCVDSKKDWDRLMREDNPVKVPVHVVRLGDAAICFNPAELFCKFGLAIKETSPAATTLICELADGWCGYIPTPEAIPRGGYSARTSSHTRCVPDAGWQIVEQSTVLLKELFGG